MTGRAPGHPLSFLTISEPNPNPRTRQITLEWNQTTVELIQVHPWLFSNRRNLPSIRRQSTAGHSPNLLRFGSDSRCVAS
jgi:hypothetical protein